MVAKSSAAAVKGRIDSQQNESEDIAMVDADGDLVLAIRHQTSVAMQICLFRVRSSVLTSTSKYFAGLLSGRFGEAARISQEREALSIRYSSFDVVPLGELPVISIEDVGRISAVKSIRPLCLDFLKILHGADIAAPPVVNLANLAIVADRFDALDCIAAYARRKKYTRAIDGKTTTKIDNALAEEKVRQRVLAAALLDDSVWLEKYSLRMILKGWVGIEELDNNAAMWWTLPMRLEEEMLQRRESALRTIQSLQDHFMALYTSRERQCRLGYDNSGQCDSFQLGETIRFFSRIGTMRLQGLILDTAELPDPFNGDLYALLDSLKQVPEYQIDKHHTHCGIRTRLLPLVEVIEASLPRIGICSDCWSQERSQYAWIDAKAPLLWKASDLRLRGQGHKEMHTAARSMFTASERHWSA